MARKSHNKPRRRTARTGISPQKAIRAAAQSQKTSLKQAGRVLTARGLTPTGNVSDLNWASQFQASAFRRRGVVT